MWGRWYMGTRRKGAPSSPIKLCAVATFMHVCVLPMHAGFMFYHVLIIYALLFSEEVCVIACQLLPNCGNYGSTWSNEAIHASNAVLPKRIMCPCVQLLFEGKVKQRIASMLCQNMCLFEDIMCLWWSFVQDCPRIQWCNGTWCALGCTLAPWKEANGSVMQGQYNHVRPWHSVCMRMLDLCCTAHDTHYKSTQTAKGKRCIYIYMIYIDLQWYIIHWCHFLLWLIMVLDALCLPTLSSVGQMEPCTTSRSELAIVTRTACWR